MAPGGTPDGRGDRGRRPTATTRRAAIATRLGFDFNWYTTYGAQTNLLPAFESRVLEELPDGFRKVLDGEGAIVLQKEGTSGIPTRVGHLLQGRKEWEEWYLPRLQFSEAAHRPRQAGGPEGRQ